MNRNIIKRILIVFAFLITLPITAITLCWFVVVELFIGGLIFWVYTGKPVDEFDYLKTDGVLGIWFRFFDNLCQSKEK